MGKGRIDYLDGHRGIAILLVILFHGFSRWPEIMPFGSQYAEFPVFAYGYLGVQLFFLISGFVILMTLEKCRNLPIFVYRRWLRLFPAMLICSLLAFISQGFLTERPNGISGAIDLIPGLTFIDPYLLGKITGWDVKSLEGAFWSLYVEFKFYIIAAVLFFTIGSKNLIHGLLVLFTLDWFAASYSSPDALSLINTVFSITTLLTLKYFGWFAAGSAFYLFYKTGSKYWYLYACMIALACCIRNGTTIEAFIANILVVAFFASSLIFPAIQHILRLRFFLFLGAVSYPLYLIHENAMISLTIQSSSIVEWIPAEIQLLFWVGVICVMAQLIAKKVEPVVKKALDFRV